MSKRKRDISYIKPNEPAFITRMKEQCGYKEGPSVETKFQRDNHSDSEVEENDDEKPTVVVLKSGDLTAEEATIVQAKLGEAPANLNDRIIFSKKIKTKASTDVKGPSTETDDSSKPKVNPEVKPAKKEKTKSNRKLLSFTEDDGEEA